MPHLRGAAYENILKAEAALVKLPLPAIELIDLDADGSDEVVMRSEGLNLFVNPSRGGVLSEIDFKPSSINLSNTLTRRPEAYHAKLRKEAEEGSKRDKEGGASIDSIHDLTVAKEEGLEKYLLFDAVKRDSFTDRFFHPALCLDEVIAGEARDLGGFAGNRYREKITKGKGGVSAELRRVGSAGGTEVELKKKVSLRGQSSFEVSYSIEALNKKSAPKAAGGVGEALFAVEVNLLLPACAGPACFYLFSTEQEEESEPALEVDRALSSRGEIEGVKEVALIDTFTGVKVNIELKEAARLWRYPIETVSLSESGFEKIFQGSSLLFLFPVDTHSSGPGRRETIFKNSFVVSIEKLS